MDSRDRLVVREKKATTSKEQSRYSGDEPWEKDLGKRRGKRERALEGLQELWKEL